MVSVPYLLVLAGTDTTILVLDRGPARYWYRYRCNTSLNMCLLPHWRPTRLPPGRDTEGLPEDALEPPPNTSPFPTAATVVSSGAQWRTGEAAQQPPRAADCCYQPLEPPRSNPGPDDIFLMWVWLARLDHILSGNQAVVLG